MAGRKPRNEDEALWQALTRDITPLRKKRTLAHDLPSKPKHKPRTTTAPLPQAPDPVKSTPPALGSDSHQRRRLKKGRMPIDGRLDLHGLTQAKAHAKLIKFVLKAQAEGKRCLLVITGKGGKATPDPDNVFTQRSTGVLRHQVPLWLQSGELAGRVIDIQPARIEDGGDGAIYVLLRRAR